MLHILFIILKILGILLLVILGVLLACLLAVLFVPIRYRGDGNYHGIKEFGAHLHVHWLLHVVSLRIAYENELRYVVRLFGFRIFGSESEERKTESGHLHEEMQTEQSTVDGAPRAEAEDDSDLETFLSGGQTGVKDLETVQTQEKTENIDSEASHSDPPKKDPEAEVPAPSGAIPETRANAGTDELIWRAEATSEKTDAAIEKAEETARLLEEAVRRRSAQRETEESQTVDDTDESRNARSNKGRRESLFQRIGSWIKRKFHALRQALLNLFTRIKNLDHKRQVILAFLENEENQKSFRLIKRQLMRMLRHVFPRKLSGQAKFGVDDPYLMGQILSAAAFLYPLYGKQIRLTPVMDADTLVLDGDLSFCGRVQIGALALMALRIWMDKNVRMQVHKYRSRGGR